MPSNYWLRSSDSGAIILTVSAKQHSCIAVRWLTPPNAPAYVLAAMRKPIGDDVVIWGTMLIVYGYLLVALIGVLLR
jgi:hypothetical protein